VKEIPLIAYKCTKCGRIHYPYHSRCLACKNAEFTEIHPKGRAKLLAYTQIFNLPWGFDQRFLVIGIAEFENGIKAMGQIKVNSLDGIRTGILLNASWEAIREQYGEHIYGLKFQPD
jgi:uncharacterized OB-fold protein